MADIFDEVTEELRQDQIKSIWKKYKKFVFIIIFLILLAVSSYKGYEYFENQRTQTNAQLFFNAISKLEKKSMSDAEKSFLELNLSNQSGYKLLSYFALADLNYKKGNYTEMEKNYKIIINNDEFSKFHKDLALIYLAMNSQKNDYNKKIQILKPIITSPSKLQSFAAELEILYLYELNKNKSATEKLKNLISRQDVKENQKNRLKVVEEIYKN